jgi:hypothetical protein
MRESIIEKRIDTTELIDLYLTCVRINVTEHLNGSSFILSAYFTLRHTRTDLGGQEVKATQCAAIFVSRIPTGHGGHRLRQSAATGQLQLQLQQFCLPASPPLHPSCSRATGGKSPWPMIDVAFKIVAVSLFAMPRHVPFFAQRGGGPHGSSDQGRHSPGPEPRRAPSSYVAVSRIYPSGQLQPIMYLQ